METSAEELYLNLIYLVKEVIDAIGPHTTLDTNTIAGVKLSLCIATATVSAP